MTRDARSVSEPMGRSDYLQYAHGMLKALGKLAEDAHFPVLSHLCTLAAVEADSQKKEILRTGS